MACIIGCMPNGLGVIRVGHQGEGFLYALGTDRNKFKTEFRLIR